MKLLLCSDIHYRIDSPISRMDSFQEIQIQTLKQISKIAKENEAIIISAGDFLHKARSQYNQSLIENLYQIFKNNKIYFIYGNHELLYRQKENTDLKILEKFDNWNSLDKRFYDEYFIQDGHFIINGFNYNENFINNFEKSNSISIWVIHKYCEEEILPKYITNGITAKDLCENNPNVDIFHVGDQHKSFIYIHPETKQIVFNTGCCTRQNISEKDYKPSCILFDTESKTYEQIFLPDNKENVFKEEKFTDQIKRENKFDNLVKLLNENKKISFDYKYNIEKYCIENKIEDEVTNMINETLEGK